MTVVDADRYDGSTASMLGDPETTPFDGEVSESFLWEVIVDTNTPWAPVHQAFPIPGTVTAVRRLPDDEFTELVATNLVTRQDVPGWNRLWAQLSADDDLRERAYNVLEQLFETTTAAIESRTLDDKNFSRAKKLRTQLHHAWDRLDREPDQQPLAWAGPAAKGFNPASRKVIDQLVNAIDNHRAGTDDPTTQDATLYAVLQHLGLDPQTAEGVGGRPQTRRGSTR